MSVRKFFDGFQYAFSGIVHSLQTQRNLRFHFVAALLVLGFGLYLRVNSRDLLFLFFAITLVIMAELFNTAVEAVVDMYVKTFHPLARIAKNAAAGAVLVAALNSLAVAYIVLFPRLEGAAIYSTPYLKQMPLNVTLTALSLVILLAIVTRALGGRLPILKKGMPSGHAMLAFGGATALLLLTGNALVATIACLLALLAAHGRLEAGSHSAFEVITGALLGILATMAAFRLAGW